MNTISQKSDNRIHPNAKVKSNLQTAVKRMSINKPSATGKKKFLSKYIPSASSTHQNIVGNTSQMSG